KSSREITGTVATFPTLASHAREAKGEINTNVQQTRRVVNRSAEKFEQMASRLEQSRGQALHIASAVDQLSATNAQAHEHAPPIHRLSAGAAEHMADSEKRTGDLSGDTEAVQELVSRFKLGIGTFDVAVAETRKLRDALQTELTAMSREGIDIFDRNYQPFGTSVPPKFKLAWSDEVIRRRP